jgi:hypothetical protein
MAEKANPPAWAAKTMTAADLAYFCLNHVTNSEAYHVVEFIAGLTTPGDERAPDGLQP